MIGNVVSVKFHSEQGITVLPSLHARYIQRKKNNMDKVEENEKEDNRSANILQSKRLTARKYKELLKSRVKRVNGSDVSILEKNKLRQTEVSVTELNHSNQDDTTNACSSSTRPERERVDFLLKRVRDSGQVERSNSSNNGTQTTLPKRKRAMEDQCNSDMLKQIENSAHCVANECEFTTVRFVEHWVPVRLSNVQVEQYCGCLFSNAATLCSSVKYDLSEKLRNILFSVRKCCDHPYLVNSSLGTSLVQGLPQHEQLDAEINLSHKLLLLYKILLEIRNRGLRVLILYQLLDRPGLISTGDILDDIIHRKFGEDSFVRIGGGISPSIRREALKRFNDKGSGKFVCLMETRACIPSIKLSCIDTVIIFNSDLDPMSDLRALQKIKLDSQYEQVKVFRLYSSHSVEEKVLILAKQRMFPEGNIMYIKQSTYHGLLAWGALYLLKRLDEFHSISSDVHSIISSGDSFVEEALLGLSALLPNNDQSGICRNHDFIVEVQQIGGFYPMNFSLLGEMDSSLVEEMLVKQPPHVFWTNVFEGRNPGWKFFWGQSPRTRKSNQWADDLVEESAGVETTPEKCSTDARSTVHRIPANRTIKKLQSRNKQIKVSGHKRYRPIHRKVKCISLALGRMAKATQQNLPAEPTSTEPQPVLPPDERGHSPPCTAAIQNDHTNDIDGPSFQPNTATDQMVEDSTETLRYSVQHSTREVPLQTECAASPTVEDWREPSIISQTHINCEPPEVSQIIDSEGVPSFCKALDLELERLQKQKAEVLKLHEDKKMELKMTCEKEIEQIRNKYDMLLQNVETAFVGENGAVEARLNKIHRVKLLAEVMLKRVTLKDINSPQVTTRRGQIVENRPNSSLPIGSEVLQLNHKSCSENIASTSNQMSAIPCVTAPTEVATSVAVRPDQLLGSLNQSNSSSPVERVSLTSSGQLYAEWPLGARTPYITPGQLQMFQSSAVNPTYAEAAFIPKQVLGNQWTTDSSMNPASSVQFFQASVGPSATSLSPTQNFPITVSRNIQIGYALRSPAPHLRHMLHRLPVMAPRTLTPDGGITFSSVDIQRVASNALTHQSPG